LSFLHSISIGFSFLVVLCIGIEVFKLSRMNDHICAYPSQLKQVHNV